MDNINRINILKNPKFKVSIIVAVTIIILCVISYIVYLNIFSAKINFLIAPKNATVSVNNENAPTSGIKRVQPGNYTITVSMPGFKTQSQDITISSGQTTNIYLGLNSNDPSTANWYIEHPEDQERLDQIGSLVYSETEQFLVQNYPIISQLPYLSSSFTIGYESSLKQPFVLQISASSGFYNNGIKRANELDPNHDIANYDVEFQTIDEGYVNPFSTLTLSANQNISSILDYITATIKTSSLTSINTTADPNYQYALIDYYEEDPIYKDHYRLVLHREDNKWVPITKIELLLSYNNYPDIPKDIIKTANNL